MIKIIVLCLFITLTIAERSTILSRQWKSFSFEETECPQELSLSAVSLDKNLYFTIEVLTGEEYNNFINNKRYHTLFSISSNSLRHSMMVKYIHGKYFVVVFNYNKVDMEIEHNFYTTRYCDEAWVLGRKSIDVQ